MEDSKLQAAEARVKAAELQLSEARIRGSVPGHTAQDIDAWHAALAEHGRAVIAYKEAQVDARLRATKAPTTDEAPLESCGRIPGRL
jgi:hypothetical protein